MRSSRKEEIMRWSSSKSTKSHWLQDLLPSRGPEMDQDMPGAAAPGEWPGDSVVFRARGVRGATTQLPSL